MDKLFIHIITILKDISYYIYGNNAGKEVLPISVYPHSDRKSVIGGHIYRGCQYPNLQGQYIYGDFVSG